jgi:hypothetical protein
MDESTFVGRKGVLRRMDFPVVYVVLPRYEAHPLGHYVLKKTGCVFTPPPRFRRTHSLRHFDEIVEPLPETSKGREEDSETAPEGNNEGFKSRGGRH